MFSAREPAATTGGNPPFQNHWRTGPDLMDLDPSNPASGDIEPQRLIVGVDFGTTYSAVSYVAVSNHNPPNSLPLSRIRSIHDFPDRPVFSSHDPMMKEVPTEVIYPLNPKFRQHLATDMESPATTEASDSEGTLDGYGDESSLSNDSDSFQWGYGVHERWANPAIHRDGGPIALSSFKLLLDDSARTEATRRELEGKIAILQRKKVIKRPTDVIADYLTCLLGHTQDQLRSENFDHTYRVEMVLAVPAIWSQRACRQMQTALAVAISRTGFMGIQVHDNSIENLFIVSEPEAAAAYMLTEQSAIRTGETFLLLDTGGGTVDANTYTVSTEAPLRLSSEVVRPGGGMFGSSFLNASFRVILSELLKDETYLERRDEGSSENMKGIIERIIVNDFEHKVKRSFHGSKNKHGSLKKSITVPGLRDNTDKRFKDGTILLPTGKIKKSFVELFDGIVGIMEDQLAKALESGAIVKTVVLIGGFAASKFLQKHLKKCLDKFCQERNCANIVLHIPHEGQDTVTAVASGAVIRALNKEQGPRRHARSSYAIMRTEPYGQFAEHRVAKANTIYDSHDGQRYVKNTLLWVLPLGNEVPPVWVSERIPFAHTFNCNEPALICREEIYVSDSSWESHYKKSHKKNEGAEKVGEMVVDFTFLRDDGIIFPIDPGLDVKGRRIGVRHYKVEYDVVLRVVDRDLQCFAFLGERVMRKCQISIAAAFEPGVK